MRLLVLCSLGWALAAASETVVLELCDGRRLHGSLLGSPSADPLQLRIERAGLRAVVQVPRSQLLSLQEPTAQDAFLQSATAAWEYSDWDAPSCWEWARRCRDAGDRLQARRWAGRVLEQDPQHREARLFLGYVWQDGTWQRPVLREAAPPPLEPQRPIPVLVQRRVVEPSPLPGLLYHIPGPSNRSQYSYLLRWKGLPLCLPIPFGFAGLAP